MAQYEVVVDGPGGSTFSVAAGTNILFEDPPIHTMHRGLMSRVFTPRRMAALEDQVRAVLRRCLDPLVGSGGFDIIAELGSMLPMRVIGMLLGIPEQDQVAVREQDRRQPAHRGRASRWTSRRRRSPAATCSPTTSNGGPSTPPTTS